MKKSQNNQLTSDISTQGVLNANKPKFDAIEAYATTKEDLDNGISDIQSLASQQLEHKQASTAAKNAAKNAASLGLMDIIRRVKAYAVVSGNENLAALVSFTATRIKRMADGDLLSTINTVLAGIDAYKTELLQYGVTPAMLLNMDELCNTLDSEWKKLLKNTAELKEITTHLQEKFKSLDAILVLIDAMVESMRTSDPVLNRLYFNARKVKNTGVTKLSARGKAYDAVTLLPITKAKLILTLSLDKATDTGSELTKTVKFSGAQGGFQFKNLPTGTYKILASYEGYAEQVVTVYINQGVLTQIEVPLTKLASAA